MLSKVAKEKVTREFKINGSDTGSQQLQIAMLTERIRLLTEHLKTHEKDYSCKRGLIGLIGRRSSFLRYLKRTNQEQYREITNRLGLKS
ncbi:MAG: 30S ribosomal protein S15 [Candidatus Babeliales bacterium]